MKASRRNQEKVNKSRVHHNTVSNYCDLVNNSTSDDFFQANEIIVPKPSREAKKSCYQVSPNYRTKPRGILGFTKATCVVLINKMMRIRSWVQVSRGMLKSNHKLGSSITEMNKKAGWVKLLWGKDYNEPIIKWTFLRKDSGQELSESYLTRSTPVKNLR